MKSFFSTNLYLIKELTKREVINRYKGSILGILWVLITPIAMLLVFSFVFGEIFQAKWPSNVEDSTIVFSINLFIGLSIFWFFSDFLGRAPIIFSSVPNYIKKVIFPLEVLPLVSLLSALFHFSIYLFIIMLFLLFNGYSINLNTLYIFLIISVTLPMLMGFGFFLASVGVYIKDIATVIGVGLNLLMFLSPIFYPLSAIPPHLQWLFHINPLTLIIEQSRIVLLQGEIPDLSLLLIYFIISIIVFILGFKVFKLTKKGFADVL